VIFLYSDMALVQRDLTRQAGLKIPELVGVFAIEPAKVAMAGRSGKAVAALLRLGPDSFT
jgi:ApbE superfamily uncharacterized protein (UPF0280 family)